MVEVKAHAGDRFAQDPPATIRLFLFCGTDAGTVSERADAVVHAALAADPSRTVVRLSGEEVAADPGRLSDEANAASLFGGDPLIRLVVPDARANVAAAVRPLVDTPPAAALVVIEAGDLKPSSPLRGLLKAAPHAAVVPCYEATPQDIAALAREIASGSNVRFAPGVLEQICGLLGADRLVARRELEKLCLYAGPGTEVTDADIDAILGESTALRADRLIDNALLGRVDDTEAELARFRIEQASLAALAARGLRMLIDLKAMRVEADRGEPVDRVVAGARPPVFFKRRAAVETILRRWPAAALDAARAWLYEAIAVARRQPELEAALISRALLRIGLCRDPAAL